MRAHLVVLARRPAYGRVKTRLAAEAGPGVALTVYRRLLSRTLRRLGGDPRWTTVVGATPPSDARGARWQRGLPAVPQAEGDIGCRMSAAMAAMPPGPVVLVGSDIPAVGRRHVAAAFRALRDHDVVVGPAEDGGFWLVGLAAGARDLPLFAGVRWSTEHALADTLAGLAPEVRVAHVATLADLDDAAALRRWRRGARPV